MSIRIEKLTLSRLQAAMQLYQTIFGEKEHTTAQILAERLHKQTGIFYIAVDETTNAVVGLKFGYLEDDAWIGRGIAVLPEYRRQGIAAALLRHFEADLQAHPTAHHYVFGSATDEGIPFHIASGYQPTALLQFADSQTREKLDLANFKITREGYNEVYQIYQIYLELEMPEQNLAYLRRLQTEFPTVDVQFVFSKTF
ncbi:MAG: GNAT family N-acetyltransferase [Caldilineaceae bacterium]